MNNMKTKEKVIKDELEIEDKLASPKISDIDILIYLKTARITGDYLNTIKTISNSNDKVLSSWLNINEKTLRSYRQSNSQIKGNIKEHIIYLYHLMKLGLSVFGSKEEFDKWLNTPNFIFDKEKPANYINTITGIRFLVDSLTAIEYGDNV